MWKVFKKTSVEGYFNQFAEQWSATLLAQYFTTVILLAFFQSFQKSCFQEYLWTTASAFGKIFSGLCIQSTGWSETLLPLFYAVLEIDRKVEMTERTLSWHLRHIKPHGKKIGLEFLVSKKFYAMVKSPLMQSLWHVSGMETTLLKAEMLKFPQIKLNEIKQKSLLFQCKIRQI